MEKRENNLKRKNEEVEGERPTKFMKVMIDIGSGEFLTMYTPMGKGVSTWTDKNYEFVETLQKTQIATVDKVINKTTGEFCVAKTCNDDEEIDILKKLGNHPHIVKVLDYHCNNEINYFYYVMEMGVWDLSYHINKFHDYKKQMSVGSIFTIVSHIAKGLKRIHEIDAVHGDLKTQNVILSKDRNWKIIDFGNARIAGSEELTRKGTPITMAPEIIITPEYHNEMVDIWALGMIFLELCLDYRLRKYFDEGKGLNNTLTFTHEYISRIDLDLEIYKEKNINKIDKSDLKAYQQVLEQQEKKNKPVNPYIWDMVHKRVGAEGMKLMMRMLTVDWNNRITAEEICKIDFIASANETVFFE